MSGVIFTSYQMTHAGPKIYSKTFNSLYPSNIRNMPAALLLGFICTFLTLFNSVIFTVQ